MLHYTRQQNVFCKTMREVRTFSVCIQNMIVDLKVYDGLTFQCGKKFLFLSRRSVINGSFPY